MRCLLLSLLFVLSSACGASNGRAWVRDAGDVSPATELSDAELAPPLATTSELEVPPEVTDPPRPRLAHVVSLGESETGASRPVAAVASPAKAPGVVVHIVNYGSAPFAGGYGYPLTYRSTTSSPPAVHTPAPSSGTPSLGGDWKAAPSYGPSFPWHTGPAPAWGSK